VVCDCQDRRHSSCGKAYRQPTAADLFPSNAHNLYGPNRQLDLPAVMCCRPSSASFTTPRRRRTGVESGEPGSPMASSYSRKISPMPADLMQHTGEASQIKRRRVPVVELVDSKLAEKIRDMVSTSESCLWTRRSPTANVANGCKGFPHKRMEATGFGSRR